MTFYLSIILDLQNFFHWYILQSWKLKRPPIQLRPHHFWTYTSNLTTVVKYKNKSARRGAQFVPIGMPTTFWNSVPPKETTMLSMRNSSILITCSLDKHFALTNFRNTSCTTIEKQIKVCHNQVRLHFCIFMQVFLKK
jgi:hypothetical protein